MNITHLRQLRNVGRVENGMIVNTQIIQCFPTPEEAWNKAVELAAWSRELGHPETEVFLGVMETNQGWHATYATVKTPVKK